jgi:hypothetical protein
MGKKLITVNDREIATIVSQANSIQEALQNLVEALEDRDLSAILVQALIYGMMGPLLAKTLISLVEDEANAQADLSKLAEIDPNDF